jgi:hypothetical protein
MSTKLNQDQIDGLSDGLKSLDSVDDSLEVKISTEDSINDQVDVILSSSILEKQDKLVSGSNIKTINGNSVLGSGNLYITSSSTWGSISGNLSGQTDLQNALNGKQNTLTSGTNIKTVNNTSLLGSGDISINPRTLASVNGSNITGTANQISASVLIPANTISTNNTIYIKGVLIKTSGSSTSTPRFYINTTNSLSGAILLATGLAMNGTSYYQRIERQFYFDGTNLNGITSSTGLSNDLTSNIITLTTFNPATAYYLIFAVQNASTTPDNLGWKRTIVQIYD